LAKLTYLPSQATVRYSSAFNPAIGDSNREWSARDFIADATLFIPPQGVRLIRFFGLYFSRSRWRWPDWEHLSRHAHEGSDAEPSPQPSCPSVPESSCRSAWAKLIAKVYEVDPLVCARCGSRMRVLAVNTDAAEVKKILRHPSGGALRRLVKIGRPPPGLDPSWLN
jgi:hypothetical protein